MSNTANYYTSTRRGDSNRRSQTSDNDLPSLRRVLPEFFEENRLPSNYVSRNPPDERNPHSPYNAPSYGSTPSPPRGSTRVSQYQSSHPQYTQEPTLVQPFAVFDAGMKPKRTSGDPHMPGRPPRASPEDPSRRYPCELCDERFDRPSALQVHMRTHTGEQPYVCSYPGCGRAFSVRSNLRRHENTHDSASAFEPVEETTYSSSSRNRGGSSQSSSAGYYSSSRAK